MKNLIVGFSQFVNEMLEPKPENTSPCCHAAILEDGTCSECGHAGKETAIDVGDIEPIVN